MDEGIRQDLTAPTSTADGSTPFVSVIMPLYNAEAYVEAAIHSVLASSFRSLEVVVVDDGSTDGSAKVVETLAETDRRVRLLHQANAGPCRARNVAVAASRGRYILPVDADDLLAPSFIADAVAVLDQQPEVKVVRPTIDFIGGRSGRWHRFLAPTLGTSQPHCGLRPLPTRRLRPRGRLL